MTLTTTQTVMVWSLRALALWGALEGAIAGFDLVTRERETMQAVRGHAAAMARLEHRAEESERLATAEEARLTSQRMAAGAGALTVPDGFTPDQAIDAVLRQDLLELGAQSPQVAAVVTPAGKGFYRAVIQARWDETVAAAPGALAGLAARRPYVDAVHVSFARQDNDALATATVQLQFSFQVRAPSPASSPADAAAPTAATASGPLTADGAVK